MSVGRSDSTTSSDQADHHETNDLMCIVLRTDGIIDQKPNGKIERGDALPGKATVYYLLDMKCEVIGHAYTPLLPFTWYLFLIEDSE
jgi:hypothetical protein